jgi:glyoxylase-like metal-dependent hydrolase (beta-lactamase superfamily II)
VPHAAHREIDVRFQGAEKAVCAHLIDGFVVDPGPESSVQALFAALGDEAPRGVLLTHIHLDHAGAAGALVQRWPGLQVWVHRNGARHVIDPSRLVASASRIYGDAMERLWGRIVPVPEANVRILDETAPTRPADGIEWAWTPGHAVHHVAYRHAGSGIVFAGDVAGVRIGDGPVLPPTPPPDIDVEAWERSLETIGGWQPQGLGLTHFGPVEDSLAQLERVRVQLHRQVELAARQDPDAFAAALSEQARAEAGQDGQALIQAAPPDQLYLGLDRWRRKHAEAA